MKRIKISSVVWQILFIAFLMAALLSCTSFVSINRNNTGSSHIEQKKKTQLDSVNSSIQLPDVHD